MSLVKQRDEQRMQQAQQLLQSTGMPIHAIAASVGYNEPLYFAKSVP